MDGCVDVWMYAWKYTCMNVRMDVWMHECMDVWTHGCRDVCIYVWMGGCKDINMSGCMDVWLYGFMEAWMYRCVDVGTYGCISVCTHACNLFLILAGIKWMDVWMYAYRYFGNRGPIAQRRGTWIPQHFGKLLRIQNV